MCCPALPQSPKGRLSPRRGYTAGKQQKESFYGRLFGQLCADLGTPKYGLLPAGKYDTALEWLRRKAAELLPDDPDALPPLQEAMV